MALGTRQIIVMFLIVGLFAFSFISFGINFQDEFNADQNSRILDDTRVKAIYDGVNSTFSSSRNTVNTFNSTITDPGAVEEGGDFGGVLFKPIVSITRAFTGIATGMFDVILGPILNALNIPEEAQRIVGTVLATIFLIVTIFLAWKLFRQGS